MERTRRSRSPVRRRTGKIFLEFQVSFLGFDSVFVDYCGPNVINFWWNLKIVLDLTTWYNGRERFIAV